MIPNINLINRIFDINDKLATDTIKKRLSAAKSRADKKGIEFELTEEIIREKYKDQNGLCHYSGRPISFHQNHPNSISPDRTTNKIGYTSDNTFLVTKLVNLLKGSLEEKDFFSLIDDMHKTIHSRDPIS